MKFLVSILLSLLLDIIPGGDAYVRQLMKRDSIIVADQLEYGVNIDFVSDSTVYGFPDLKGLQDAGIVVIRDWQIDTLRTGDEGRKKPRRRARGPVRGYNASLVIAPFQEGVFGIPALQVEMTTGESTDTLVFNPVSFEVAEIPIDTASFVIHDIKDQIRYPVTVEEIIPWAAAAWLTAVLVIAAVCIIMIRRTRAQQDSGPRDPAYIVALRKLERYRSDKNWAPEKQKLFYSGVTDALKEYIDERFGIDAPEMTTAELFTSLAKEDSITPEMWSELKNMFERADYVKFAKYTASDDENSATVPAAVRFVTSTWQFDQNPEEGEEAAR